MSLTPEERLKYKGQIEKGINEIMYVRYYPDWLKSFVCKITGGKVNLRVKPYRYCVRCGNVFMDRNDRSWFCTVPCALSSGDKLQEEAKNQVNEWFD